VNFCTNCGAAIAGTPQHEPTSAERLEERRVVSILFVDLTGFTELGDLLDPEDVRALQSTYFSTVSRLIQRRGGVVEKYIGDAVMAVFGAPVTQEDDAARAVRAGLELQDALDRQLVGPREPLRVRVGVATGEALVDLAALHDGGQALVAGDVVNTASRLQSHAPAGGVLVSAATWRASVDQIEYGERPPLTVRGKASKLRTWLAVGLVHRRWDDHPDGNRFVNRGSELTALRHELNQATADQQARLVCLVGPAGIGKSRLIRELVRSAHPEGAQDVDWFGGRCLPPGEGSPYAALADIVRSVTGVAEADDAATAQVEVRRALAELFDAAELPRMVEALAPLIGFSAPEVGAEETETAWQLLFDRLAKRRPTVLVFEDLYWADPVLLRFVTRLVSARPATPLLVVATLRPDAMDTLPTWAGNVPHLTTVRLDPLTDEHTDTLFRDLLGNAKLPAETMDRLTTLSGGTPLYAHEYVRMLADRGGVAELAEGAEIPLPDTVHAVIASRIDLLEMRARRALQAAAVVGPTFWPGAVAAVADLSRSEVNRILAELARREFIRPEIESSLTDEPAYAFTHALVRDLAYRRQPRAARLVRHQHAARWLDRHAASRAGDTVEALAHHRVTALELARQLNLDVATFLGPARTALVAAAEQAASLHAVDVALRHLDRAVALWAPDAGNQPAEDEVARLRALVLRLQLSFLADSRTFFGDDGPAELATHAERLLALGAREAAARTLTLLGNVEWALADRGHALAHLNRALAIFDTLPDSAEKANAYAELARLLMTDYECVPAIEAARTAAAMARRLRLVEIEANALVTEGSARYISGDPDGLTLLEEAVELCRKEQLRALRRAALNLAVALQEEGEIARSYALSDESSAQVIGDASAATLHYSDDCMRAYFAGDWRRTLAAGAEYLANAEPESTEWEVLMLRVLGGKLRALAGQDPAVDIDHCLAIARRGGFRLPISVVLGYGALCRAITGDHDAAAEYLRQLEAHDSGEAPVSREWLPAASHAASLVSEERSRWLRDVLRSIPRPTLWVRAALCTLDGGVSAHQGDYAAAARHFTEAATVYDRMGNVTDATLSATWAIRAWHRAGAPENAIELSRRVRDFAAKNEAPVLLALTRTNWA
jgi:class 3 adenylate cyclase/tetratricopeptide (TPR) repeat protein